VTDVALGLVVVEEDGGIVHEGERRALATYVLCKRAKGKG